eukprot:5643110-Alexandrium_andersonii.AAC.1
MSASLVGSEMCIRDSPLSLHLYSRPRLGEHRRLRASVPGACGAAHGAPLLSPWFALPGGCLLRT